LGAQSSIERLKCEYIDLYQIHFPSRDTPLFGPHFFAPKGEARPFPFNDEAGYEMFEQQVRASLPYCPTIAPSPVTQQPRALLNINSSSQPGAARVEC